jgi:GT2 family glycosyltransferase
VSPVTGDRAGARVLSIVVNWRLAEETAACLSSLLASTIPSDVVVVDNESDERSRQLLGVDSRVEILSSERNLGFGAACNLAFTSSLKPEHEYVFLLNNDASIAPDALEHLVACADADASAGILGAKVYFRHAPNTIWFAGARRRQGVLAATDFGRNQVDRGQYDEQRRVDYIFGAAMLIRRSVLETLGGFDERFFLYLEDLDLCLRAQKNGYNLLFVPEARVWHAGSASTANDIARRRYYMARSTITFLRKHTSLLTSVPVMSFWAAVYLRDIASDLFNGNGSAVRSCFTGLGSGLVDTFSLLRRRAPIRKDEIHTKDH